MVTPWANHAAAAATTALFQGGRCQPQPTSAAGLDVLRSRARKNVEEAIGQIPMERKAACLEAMQKAPQLFANESDPLKFLRRCNYNIWDASERLCAYWTLRRELFGPHRAFLPLILTGDGALDKNDIMSLNAGYPAILPGRSNGKQVVYCDRRQFVPTLTAENRRRGMFYLVNILSQDEGAQTDGVIVLSLVSGPRVQIVGAHVIRTVFHFLIHTMPIKLQLHVLNMSPKNRSRTDNRKLYELQDKIATFVEPVISSGLDVTKNDIEIHFEREVGDLQKLLQDDFGLNKASIPSDLGGDWSFVEASLWCRDQASLERERFKHLPPQPAENSEGFAAGGKYICPQLQEQEQHRQQQTVPQDHNEQTRRSKKRSNNVIYSRRKRERRRYEEKTMVEERDRLQQEQDALKKENARLYGLWKQAHALLEGKRQV